MGYRYYRYCPSSNGRETRNNNLIFVESRASRVPIAAQLKSHRTGKKESEMSLNYTDNKEKKQGDPPRSTLNSSDKFFRAVVLRSNGIFVRTKIVSTKKKKGGKCERFEKKKIRTWKISDIAEIYIFHDETARGKKSIYRREAPLSGKKFHPKVFIGVGRPMDHFPVLENEKWRVARTESGPRGLPLSRLRRDNPRWSLSIPLPTPSSRQFNYREIPRAPSVSYTTSSPSIEDASRDGLSRGFQVYRPVSISWEDEGGWYRVSRYIYI